MYNAENYIEKTITSIINQDFDDYELIIVDDGSTDKSKEIVDKYVDNKIHYLYQENSGAPAARNFGFSRAKGDYVLYFDADDTLNSQALRIFTKYTEAGYDLIIGQYDRINETGNKISNKNNCKDKYSPYFIDPLPGNKLYRKQFIIDNQLKFEKLKIGQDLNFYLQVLAHNPKVKQVKESIFSYYIHEGSISRSYNVSILDIITCFEIIEKKKYSIYEENKEILETLKYNHYSYHFYKIPLYSDRKMKIKIYDTFKEAYNKLNYDYLLEQYIDVNKKKVNLALRYKYLFISPLVKLLY